MSPKSKGKYTAKAPELDLTEGSEMLREFTAESLKHLLTAKNSILVLETVPDDRESVENIFKSFHTIKGLAGFLNLDDLQALTEETETLLDMTRKNIIKFDEAVAKMVSDSIDSLHKLVELLNEQVNNGGELASEYLDVGPLIDSIRDMIINAKPGTTTAAPNFKRDIPQIEVEQEGFGEEDEVETPKETLPTSKAKSTDVTKISAELEEAKRELERAQGKLAERQRELIRERELAIKLTQQAQAQARGKSEYLASMAHEIRTLINAILGFTDLLSRSKLDKKQKEQIDTIVMSGNLLLGIVNDILDYSKVEAGKLKLEITSFNLLHLIEDVFKIIRTRLGGKSINLYFQIDAKVPLDLMGDPTRLKQILMNLIDNAIKFTEKGQIGLTVTFPKGETKLDKKINLLFMVEDTGVGIPADRKDAIFESFTQADSTITRRYGGSGLGLTLCKNYVENMGGEIWIDSVEGKGSKFIFTAQFDLGKKIEPDPLEGKLDESMPGKRVTIVSHDSWMRDAINKVCMQCKLNVDSIITTTQEAVDYFWANKSAPNLIFIDVMLPDNEGYMLVSKIRQDDNYRNTKIVAVSSNIQVNDPEGLRQHGFDEFLAKPIIREECFLCLQAAFSNVGQAGRVLSHDMIQEISCEGISILVAEDSIPNQELLKAHFEGLGCEVDYANNGQEAVEKVRNNHYDICLMDLQMPMMNGLEATQVIRNELNERMPIIALTAAGTDEERDECLRVGMTDYLAKPFDVMNLKEKIIRAVKM